MKKSEIRNPQSEMKKSAIRNPQSEILRILLLDDDPNDRALVIRALKKDFGNLEVVEAINAAEMKKALKKGGFDLVITDYHLYWTDGIKNLNAVKERWPDCPVIMFTGTGTEEIAVEAMKSGLDDYVLKSPKHFGRLPAAVRSALEKAVHRQDLRETREKYRSLIKTVVDAVILVDAGGKVEMVNDASLVLFGKPEAQIIGKDLGDLLPGKEAKPLRAAVNRVVNTKNSTVHVAWIKKRYLESVLSPVLNPDDRVTSVTIAARDITERQEAGEALRESEARFRNLMEYIPGISIQGYHTNGTVFYWNRASELIYGYTAKEAIGKNLGDLIIPPDLKPLFRQSLKLAGKVKRSGKFMPAGELDLLRKDGKLVSVYSIHTAVYRKGKEALLFCIDVDLSERKKAEEALRESEERYRGLFDISPVGIFLLDFKGNIVSSNAKGADIYGYSREEILKLRVRDIVPEEISKNFPRLIENAKKEKFLFFESRGKRKNGEVFPVELYVSLFHWKGEELVQALAQDIGERKRAEDAERLKKATGIACFFRIGYASV